MSVFQLFLGGLLILVGLLGAPQANGEELLAQPPIEWAAAIPPPQESLEPSIPPASFLLTEPLPPDPLPAQPVEEPSAEAIAPVPPAPLSPSPIAPYPVIVNEWVEYFLERFQTPSRREIIGLWLNRSGRYLDMIREVFAKHGLPEELAYVAMIESGFNPAAVSRAGAKGLWQFMEQTARRYGLRVDRWVDERLDPEKSTVAAALYLRELFGQFGSWFLAKAAYNAGEMKVARAVQRSRTTDFWTLTRGRVLREETKRFVPAILAALLIGQDPERYGFEVTPQPPLVYDLVMAPPLLEIKRLAARCPFSVEDLQRLNPELRRGVTPPGGSYALKVPLGSGGVAQRILEESLDLLAKETFHVVKPRETLGQIAKRHGVSVSELVRWNGLSNASRIFPGDRLRVAEAR